MGTIVNDTHPMDFRDTVEMMNSDDYKERFIAEYRQLEIRFNKLVDMCVKWENGKLDFTPTCPKCTYELQLRAMGDYMAILEMRAKMEGIAL